MKKILFILCLFLGGCSFMNQEKIVCCIGDSITFGYTLSSQNDSYPSLLEDMVDENYTIYNGGIPGITSKEYIYTDYFEHSKEVKPDIVIIQLGSNDSGQYINKESFKQDYLTLVNAYPKAKIYLCTPPCPFYVDGNFLNYGVNEENLLEIVDIIQEIGNENHLSIIDLYAFTKNHKEWFELDGIHPNKEGTKEIANLIYNQLIK